ncbi:MAG: hypothetical protein OJF47_002502 [Nitrospira sp.]|nr:MAG: hypothetical protein OJF47_002502 [Nitrospira sp.]
MFSISLDYSITTVASPFERSRWCAVPVARLPHFTPINRRTDSYQIGYGLHLIRYTPQQYVRSSLDERIESGCRMS